jgi:hypothetical protein
MKRTKCEFSRASQVPELRLGYLRSKSPVANNFTARELVFIWIENQSPIHPLFLVMWLMGAVNRSIVPTVQYPTGPGSENTNVNQVTNCDRNNRFVEELESALKQGALELVSTNTGEVAYRELHSRAP